MAATVIKAVAMQVQTLLQAQLVVSVTESDGTSVDATGAFVSCLLSSDGAK